MSAIGKSRRLAMKTTNIILIGSAGGLLVAASLGFAGTGISSHLRQVRPIPQNSLNEVAVLNDVPRHASSPAPTVAVGEGSAQPVAPSPAVEPEVVRSYDPSGRRDPFVPVLQQLGLGAIDPTLPPLQRIGLTELNLIAVL